MGNKLNNKKKTCRRRKNAQHMNALKKIRCAERMKAEQTSLDLGDNGTMLDNSEVIKGKQSPEQWTTMEPFLDLGKNETIPVNSLELEGNQSSERSINMEPFLDIGKNKTMPHSFDGSRMSTEDWNIERYLCRCCHSDGTFKSLSSICSMETDGTYSDLLADTLDIKLCPVSEPLSAAAFSICEVCIARLRDAHCLKTQVLMCETHFQNMYKNNCIKVAHAEVEVKEELLDCDEADFGSINGDDFTEFTYNQKAKSKKVKLKGTTAKMKNGTKKVPSTKPCERVLKRVHKFGASDYERVGNTFKCLRCEKTYTTMRSLSYHIRSIHMGHSIHTCSVCNKPCLTKTQLKIHKLTEHAIDERIKCNACERSFNVKQQYEKHMLNFHKLGDKFSCQQCDYECFDKYRMNYHLLNHKLGRDYHCKYCKKSFKSYSNLSTHEKIHTGERTKVCKECGKAFVQKASLNYHMGKYHPGVKF